jgi:hypothetical protein
MTTTADYVYTVTIENSQKISDYIKIYLKMSVDIYNTYTSNEIRIVLDVIKWNTLLTFDNTTSAYINSTSGENLYMALSPSYASNLNLDLLLRHAIAENDTDNIYKNPMLYNKVSNINSFLPSYNDTVLTSTIEHSAIYTAVDGLLEQIKNKKLLDVNDGNIQEIVSKYIDGANTDFELFFNTLLSASSLSSTSKLIKIVFKQP